MGKAWALALALVAGPALATETVVVQGVRPPTSDQACTRIAEAKVKEWAQIKVKRDRLDSFADGRTRASEFVFTSDRVYVQSHGIWRSAQAAHDLRLAGSAAEVAKRMSLADCRLAEQADGRARYTFSQGEGSAGEIWIADASGLPLSMEIRLAQAGKDDPVAISFRYAFGDAVEVPRGAELAAFEKSMRTQQWITALQSGRPAW